MNAITALDRAAAAVTAEADRSLAAHIDRTATLMCAEPGRIIAALYPFAPRTWPTHKSMVEMLADARSFIRAEPDAPGLIAVVCAHEALVRLLAAVGAVSEDAARRCA